MSDIEELGASARDALKASDIPMNAVSMTVDEVDGVILQANGPTNRDRWNSLRGSITDALDAAGLAYRAKDSWAFVEVTSGGGGGE